MTRQEAKQALAHRALLMYEANGSSTLDGDAVLKIIDEIYDSHDFYMDTMVKIAQSAVQESERRGLEIQTLKLNLTNLND